MLDLMGDSEPYAKRLVQGMENHLIEYINEPAFCSSIRCTKQAGLTFPKWTGVM